MPSHQHRSVSSKNGAISDYFGGSTADYGFTDGVNSPACTASANCYAMSSFTGGGAAHNHGETTASSPGTNSKLSTSQSILNPYITVYIWKRIS